MCLCLVKNMTEEQWGPCGCPGEAVIGDDAGSLPLHPQPGVWGKFG